jgi:hypothetical protein
MNGYVVPTSQVTRGGDGASIGGPLVGSMTIVTPDPATTGDSLARGLRRVQYLDGGMR